MFDKKVGLTAWLIGVVSMALAPLSWTFCSY